MFKKSGLQKRRNKLKTVSLKKIKTMLTKVKLLQSIKDLPDKFTLDDLLDRIVLLQKIEIGLEQSQEGQTKSTEQSREKLKKWLT